MTIINHHVRHIPEAQFTSKCAVCDDTCAAGEPIYWHGSGMAARELGRNSHDGCYWDDKRQGGPAPHLTWGQVEALHLATAGGFQHPADSDAKRKVQRLLGAVAKDVSLKRRKLVPARSDQDAALRLGPDLLEGYRIVIKAMGHARDQFWYPVEANGATRWTNPAKVTTEERPRITDDELNARRDERIHLSFTAAQAARAFREKHLHR